MNKSTSILLVDDDPAIRLLFSEILSAEGYVVLEAGNGQQGLQVAREKRPDLVLLDVMLPDLSGLEVCREIKKDPVLLDIFVVLFSGAATRTAQKVAGLETGADDYMSKRVDRDEFLARIRTMLRLRDATVALRASERHYRRLVEILPDAVGLIDRQGRFTAVNPQAVAMLGYDNEQELLQKSAFDLNPPLEHERLRANLTKTLEGEAVRNMEYTLIRKSGEAFPIELSTAALNGAWGEPHGIVGVARDITERKRSEAALRASEERFRQLAENIREVFWMTDPAKNQLIYISPGYEEVWGRTRESHYAAPRSWIEAIHPDDRERVQAAALTKQSTGQYAENYRIVRPDGSIRWIEDRAFPVRDDAGKVFRIVGVANDITERKLAEQRLAAQHAVVRALAESATLNEVATKILASVCECLGWEVGALWQVEGQSNLLRCVEVWCSAAIQVPEFVNLTRSKVLTRGEGLPGRVWLEQGPIWIPDALADSNFPRGPIAFKAGLHAAFGFPILLGNQVIGVIEFFSRRILQPDQALLGMMGDLGGQIGQFIAHKRAEQALRDAEANYRSIFEHSIEGIFQTTPDGRYLSANPALARMLGYSSPEELIAEITDIGRQTCVRPESRIELKRQLDTDGQVRAFENEIYRKDGSKRWNSINARVVRDASGAVRYYEGTSQDITERKRAEQALRESEAGKTAIMESALDAILTIDWAGKIVEFNFAAEKMFGCSRANAIGRELAAVLIPASLRDWFERGLAGHFATDEGPVQGGRIEIKALRADGTEFPAELTVTRINREGPPMWTVFIRDNSSRKRAEAQIATLAHAVESTAEPICITDLADRFTFVNRAFQKTYGYAEAEILGKTPEILFSPNNPQSLMTEILTQTRSGGWRGEVLDLRKDGSEFPVSLTTSQIKDQNGRILGLMGVAEDITERKRTEEQIRLLADAVQSTRELISITDSQNLFTFVNQAFLETYGYGSEEVLGRTPEFLYSSKNPPGLCQTVFLQTVEKGWKGELLNCRKDGTEFPISLSTSQIKNGAGKIIGLVGVARDISERIRAEKRSVAFSQLGYRLSTADTRQQAAEIILDIGSELFGWDAGYVVLYSPKEDKITPLLTLDTVGSERFRFPPTSLPPKPTPLMRRVLQQGAALINPTTESAAALNLVRFGNVNSSAGCMMFVPIHASGAVIGLVSIQSYAPQAYAEEDLTFLQTLADICGGALQRIEGAEALRATEAKYRSIFENATEGIFQTTHEGRYLNVNPALARLFGYQDPEELISTITNIERQTFVSSEIATELNRLLTAQDSVLEFEAERYRKDRSKFWTRINVRKVRDADGNLRYYEGTVQDITRRKQAQTQNAALTRLGYGLSAAITSEQAAKIILDTADDLFGWDAGYVHSYTQTEDKLVPLLTFDTVGGERRPIESTTFTLDPSPLMRLIMKEGARLTNREDGSSAAADLVPFGDVQRHSASLMHVPIRLSGGVIGILSIQSYTPKAYSEHDLVLFQALADHCANTLHRIDVVEVSRATEAKYRGIFENATEGIFQSTPDGHVVVANPALAHIFGYESPEEMMSSVTRLDRQLYVSSERRADFKRALETQGFVQGFEAENFRKDGGKIRVTINARAIRDASGTVRFYEGTIQDITERKWTENLLQVRRDFGILLSSTNDLKTAVDRLLTIALQSEGVDCGGVYLVDPETGALDLAGQHGFSERFTKRAAHFARDEGAASARRPRQPLARIVQQLKLEGLLAKEVIPVQHNGQVVAVFIAGSHGQGGLPARSRYALDAFAAQAGGAITRIQAEQSLRANRQLLEKTLNNLHDAVFLLDAKTGIVQECNSAATHIFGYTRDEMVGRTPNFLHPTKELLEHLGQYLPLNKEEKGFTGEFELKMKRKDGAEFHAEQRMTAIKDETGRLLSWVNVVREITERKRAEEALRKLSQRLIEAQETERSRVARELHDGVNQIIASAKMRLRKVADCATGLNPAGREILARCDRLLVQALEENRRIAHNLRPSDLDELGWASACRNFCKELSVRANLLVKCSIARLSQRLPPAVELNLFRIVQEALNNVEKHAQAKTVWLRLTMQNDGIVLRIQDDGRGFDLKQSKTRKRERGGLGLTNMRERAAALGGGCEIESSPEQGAQITVRVPRQRLS